MIATLTSHFFILYLILTSHLASAQSSRTFFSDDIYGFSIERNYPLHKSLDIFSPGQAHPKLSYWHPIADEWIVGLSLNFKMIQKRSSFSQTSVLAISQSPTYNIRLNEKTYLSAGPIFSLLMPTEKALIPIKKLDKFESEIGTGVKVLFFHQWSEKYFFTANLERWRGTETTRLEGFEIGLGLAYQPD